MTDPAPQASAVPTSTGSEMLEPYDGVLAALLKMVKPVQEIELLSIGSLLGRVIYQDIVSPIPLPPFDNSAVDGYGISASDVDLSTPGSLRLALRLSAGHAATARVGSGEAAYLLTGAPVPKGVCAVVAQEYCQVGTGSVVINQPVLDGANIRRRGEDVTPGSVVVEKGTIVDARHMAILAAAGCATVPVRRRVRVALLSTGSELRDASQAIGGGVIHDVNRPMLQAMLSKPWIDVMDFGICADDPVMLAEMLETATTDSDLVITSGGASGSDEDHVGRVIASMGGEAWHHRLAIKPGKPLVIGRLKGQILLALPGNPLAAMVSFILFGWPLLAAIIGNTSMRPAGQVVVCGSSFSHSVGRTEFVPAAISGQDDAGRSIIRKLGRGGSARLRPLVLADGLVEIPAEVGDLLVGSRVLFHPFQVQTPI